MKKTFITIFACITAILALTITACNDDKKLSKEEEIKQAVSTVVEFLRTTRDGGNYSAVSEFYDGSTYKYYTEDAKIKVEYKGELFYGTNEHGLYKISQADDMTWHKTADITDLSDPVNRINNLINGISNTNYLSLWTDYDSKTKTLTATYSDGSATYKLDAGEFEFITYLTNSGTTRHIINNVGNTTVSLPENIIDDTQE